MNPKRKARYKRKIAQQKKIYELLSNPLLFNPSDAVGIVAGQYIDPFEGFGTYQDIFTKQRDEINKLDYDPFLLFSQHLTFESYDKAYREMLDRKK